MSSPKSSSKKDVECPKSKKDYYCGYFLKGYCPLGEKCESLHKVPEQKKYTTIPCKFFVKKEVCPRGEKCWFAHFIPTNYKTVLCESFEVLGRCPSGGQCTFAHGKEELRK